MAIIFLAAPNLGASGITAGIGMNYIPIARLDYTNQASYSYEMFDNIVWGPEVRYRFGDGFSVGLNSQFYRKRIANGTTSTVASMWGIGLRGDYGYALTESGHTLLVAGAEIGYGELTDKSSGLSKSAGSMSIAGLLGIRFHLFRNVSMEMDYRPSWLEFDIKQISERKYKYSGNGFRVSLGYQFGHDNK